MTVVTEVQGIINQSRLKEFEQSFSAAKLEVLPEGLVSSILLKNVKEIGAYTIQTLWESMDALDKMRSATQTPKAVELFQKVGVEAKVSVYQVFDSIP